MHAAGSEELAARSPPAWKVSPPPPPGYLLKLLASLLSFSSLFICFNVASQADVKFSFNFVLCLYEKYRARMFP